MKINPTQFQYRSFIQMCLIRIRKSPFYKVDLKDLETKFGYSAFSYMEWAAHSGWLSTGSEGRTIMIREGNKTKDMTMAEMLAKIKESINIYS